MPAEAGSGDDPKKDLIPPKNPASEKFTEPSEEDTKRSHDSLAAESAAHHLETEPYGHPRHSPARPEAPVRTSPSVANRPHEPQKHIPRSNDHEVKPRPDERQDVNSVEEIKKGVSEPLEELKLKAWAYVDPDFGNTVLIAKRAKVKSTEITK